LVDRDIVAEVLRRRGLIRRVVSHAPSRRRGCQVEMKPLPGPVGWEPSHGAVDGGHALLVYEGFTVYIARAWGRIFPPNGGDPARAAAVGLVVPPENPEDRVGYYREALEGLVAWRLAPGSELLLFDGSIRGAIRWWRPGYGRRGPTLSEMLAQAEAAIIEAAERGILDMDCPGSVEGSSLLEEDSRLRCVEEFIRDAPFTGDDRGWRPASNLLAMRLAEADPDRALDVMWVIALEVAEKLYLYKEAVLEAWSRGGLPVFISKTSTGTRMCGGPQSDLQLLRRLYPMEPGYVLWDGSVMHGALEVTGLERGEDKKGGKAFYPRILGLDEFYRERMLVVEFYARLARGGPWLMIDLVLDGGKVRIHGLEEARGVVEEALSLIQALPQTRGYPLSLVIAHKHARITPDEARYYINGLALTSEPRARGMLSL